MSRYNSTEAQQAEQIILDIQARSEGNNYCADCSEPRPGFINLAIGTFICEVCVGIHRAESKRRIKSIYGGDLTFEDVRRMETVGNDIANRKFLATWNPHEMREPDRRNIEELRQFLWLKYDGAFKKKKAPPRPAPAPMPAPLMQSGRGYPGEQRFYDDRAGYRREQDLFRETPQQNPGRPQGYWGSRFESPSKRIPPPGPPPMRPHDDYYSRAAPIQPPSYPDRYRNVTSNERFRPPQPTQLVPYGGRGMRPARPRYAEQPPVYEDYASYTSEERNVGLRRGDSLGRRGEHSQEAYGYAEGEPEEERNLRKKKSSKGKGKSRRKKSSLEKDAYYSEEEEEEEEEEVVRSKKEKKKDSKKSKKSSKSKRKTFVEDEEEYNDEEEDGFHDDDDDDDDEDDAESEDYDVKRSKRRGKKDKRTEKDRDSIVTVDTMDGGSSNTGQAAKTEFDLMSEWMGESKDTQSSTANSIQPAQQVAGAIPAAMQQAFATQVPGMPPPPMSVYPGMMPMPPNAFMSMVPGFPGMGMPGMPGMPPGMPGMIPGMPGMPGGMNPGIPGMPGMPGMPGGMTPGMPQGGVVGPAAAQSPGMGGMAGVMNGMQGLNLNQQMPQGNVGTSLPPPPPPVGMPAGPPPGPPPEPPTA